MAKKKTTEDDAPKKGRKGKTFASGTFQREDANPIKEYSLDGFSEEHYGRYGRDVLEDRAIPDFRDGMSPVNRRILWSAYDLGMNSRSKFHKAARIVGDVLGRFHPHGDSAAYKALVGMTNVGNCINNINVGLVEGSGNWGSMTSPTAAAMRYTEARLSRFTDTVIFDKFYMPVMNTVPNFDSSFREPLVLPTLLPILLLNGRFGIAPGATTSIPSFEPLSVIKVLEAAYSGKELDSKFLSKTLTAVTTFGGEEVDKKSEGRKALFTTHKGSVEMKSHYVWDAKKRTMTYTRFTCNEFEKAIIKISSFEGVASVQDMSAPADKYGTLVITLRKQADHRLPKLIKRIEDFMTSRQSYVLNFTQRRKDATGQSEARMIPMTLPKMLTAWVKWRTGLEKRACRYWINEDEKELRRLALLLQAVDMIDLIVKLLKDKKLKSNDDVYQAYAKKAKITVEEAKYVMGRPIISLRNLSKKALNEDVAKVKANKKSLEKREAKPHAFMLTQLETFKALFK